MTNRAKRAAVNLIALLIENLEPEEAYDIIAHALSYSTKKMTLEQSAVVVSVLAQQAQSTFLAKELEAKEAAK